MFEFLLAAAVATAAPDVTVYAEYLSCVDHRASSYAEIYRAEPVAEIALRALRDCSDKARSALAARADGQEHKGVSELEHELAVRTAFDSAIKSANKVRFDELRSEAR